MKKSYLIIIILLGLVITLSIGRAILHNTLSTTGIFVSQAEQEINALKTQNAILSEEFLAASSLTNITEKAKVSGFTNKDTLMVLKTSRPLAVRP
jgi:cell division protein FtsL